MGERFHKEKPKRIEKFSEANLFEKINSKNSYYGPIGMDGEVIRIENPNLEKVLRKTGSDCVDYKYSLLFSRAVIEFGVISGMFALGPIIYQIAANNPNFEFRDALGLGIVGFIFGTVTIDSGYFAARLITGMRKSFHQHEDIKDIEDIKNTEDTEDTEDTEGGFLIYEIKKDIEQDLIDLGLDKKYAKKHFKKIVKAFVKRENALTQAEEENNEITENEERRKRLGLTEGPIEETQSLNSLLDKQENKE